uniref:NADPH-dependent oxidoreductase n=1 Tax=candidate division WOR-3 bacterium TaxID=2052148 RepID=A0A7V1EJ68_UNCW3
MKILVTMGSPRKGDSYQITKIFEEKMNALKKVEFKYLFLKEVNLEYCRGCCACMAKGEDFCPAKDITLKIREEMLKSDGAFFVSHVYAHQVTALMKNFIDHFSYIFHRPCFFDKVAIVISTTGGSGLKEVLDYLEGTARGWGFNLIGKIGIIASAFEYAPKYRAKMMKEIEVLSGVTQCNKDKETSFSYFR